MPHVLLYECLWGSFMTSPRILLTIYTSIKWRFFLKVQKTLFENEKREVKLLWVMDKENFSKLSPRKGRNVKSYTISYNKYCQVRSWTLHKFSCLEICSKKKKNKRMDKKHRRNYGKSANEDKAWWTWAENGDYGNGGKSAEMDSRT